MSNASLAVSTAEQPLRARIDRAQQKLGGLENDLRTIDGELSNLATQREQYRLLETACDSLAKLGEQGVAAMFWGERADASKAAEHVRQVGERMRVFREQIEGIEDKRRSVLDEIKSEHEVLGILEDDLFEVQEQEEQRLLEWVIEREETPLLHRAQKMAWAAGGEDDWRFRKALAASLIAAIAIGLTLPLIDLPVPEPSELMEMPERFVKLIKLEQRRPVTPPQPVIEEPRPEEPKPPEPEPEPVLAEQPPADVPPAEQPAAPAPAVAQEEPPRQRAETAGILAFRESFSTMTRRPSARLGSEARIGNTGDAALGPAERSMVTTQAPGSSGGINLSAFSRDIGGNGGGGGGAMAGVEVTRVASAIGGGPGGTGPGGTGVGDRASGGALAGRTDEEIQIVFDRYKAALYRLYNRELRNDPTLRGQMVLKLTIEPDGSVSFVQVQASDMNAPALAAQVVERVKTFAFGAKNVPAVTILYPIDFLPAA